jgi:hypothetical protein
MAPFCLVSMLLRLGSVIALTIALGAEVCSL